VIHSGSLNCWQIRQHLPGCRPRIALMQLDFPKILLAFFSLLVRQPLFEFLGLLSGTLCWLMDSAVVCAVCSCCCCSLRHFLAPLARPSERLTIFASQFKWPRPNVYTQKNVVLRTTSNFQPKKIK